MCILFRIFHAAPPFGDDPEFLEPVEAEHSVYVGTAAIIMVAVEAGLIVLMDSDHWINLFRKKSSTGRPVKKKKAKTKQKKTKKSRRMSNRLAHLDRVRRKYLAVQKLVYLSNQPKPDISVIFE